MHKHQRFALSVVALSLPTALPTQTTAKWFSGSPKHT